MSGTITLGGHTYNNVSGGKFDEIKKILDKKDEPEKLKARDGDVFYLDNAINPKIRIYFSPLSEWAGDVTVENNPNALFNLLDLVAEMKSVMVKHNGWTAFIKTTSPAVDMLLWARIGPPGTIKFTYGNNEFDISNPDAFRFAAQLLALCRKEK